MQTKTYAQLLELIQSLAGVYSFSANEQTQIMAMANRRIYEAYNYSPTWPRYIKGAEARPGNDGLIETTYDDVAGVITSTSATRSGTTVTIVCGGAVTFVAGMEVNVSGLTGSVSPNGLQIITSLSETNAANDTFTYSVDSGTGTETYTGTATITPTELSDVATFHRVWNGNPFAGSSAMEYEFFVDSDGAHIVGELSGLGAFWVGYKKEWDGPFDGSSTDIPIEFFYYAAHATFADFLRLDLQNDKAMAEERIAMGYLLIELEKADMQRNNNMLFRRISTYTSRQSR